jgi:RNA polymerase sigma-70 factor (ECF subfamily)
MSALPSIHEAVATPHEADHAGALYEAYSERILGYCLRRLPTREEAEDAVQHTFLNAFRGLCRGVVPRSEAAWLFKIAENVCRERRRSAWRRGRVETVQDPDGMQGLAAPSPVHDELAGLADALAELPPNQQRAILLREWQGLSYREIAGQLELTEAAVETLLFRARRSLADRLDRSRARAGTDLGSVGGWGKSLAGGAAAKVAATAVVVGILAATPALRSHHPQGVSASGGSHPATAARAVARSARKTEPAVHVRRQVSTSRRLHPTGRARGTVPGTRPNHANTSSNPQAAAPSHRRAATPKARPRPARVQPPAQVAPAFTAPDQVPLESQSP